MKQLLSKYKLEIIGALVGAMAGLAYWHFVGCASGSCAITSNPYRSSLYGALLGALSFGMFNTKKVKTDTK